MNIMVRADGVERFAQGVKRLRAGIARNQILHAGQFRQCRNGSQTATGIGIDMIAHDRHPCPGIFEGTKRTQRTGGDLMT